MNRAPQYGAVGFRKFMDRLLNHGLEAYGLYYGVYRAEVVDVAGFVETGTGGGSSDKEKQALLKVRIPAVGDTEEVSRTAYPIMPLAGSGHGMKTMPPKGSYVWVVFENGQLDMPVYIGGWFRVGDMPERLESTDAHGWVTPIGQKLVFDDEGNTYLEEAGAGNLVNIGAEADEAAAKGDTLKSLLDETFDAILQLTVNTGVGPSTPPLNSAAFQAIKQKLSTFLSTVVKVK